MSVIAVYGDTPQAISVLTDSTYLAAAMKFLADVADATALPDSLQRLYHR